MDNQTFEELKEDYVKHIKGYVNEYGNLFAHISVFADIKEPQNEEEEKPAIIHIPIPDEFMRTGESKDKFVDDILPEIIDNIKEKFNPIAIGWAAEATMRVAGSVFDMKKDDWTKLPVSKDVIIICIDSKENNNTFLYEIKHISDDVLSNLQVTQSGEFAERIQLIDITNEQNQNQMKHVGGRFSKLYKKFFN